MTRARDARDRFSLSAFYPTDARIAQVDIRPQAIGRRVPIDLGIVGQVGPTLSALIPRIKVKSDRRHLDTARTDYANARKSLDELATGRPGGPLHPQHLVRVINEKAADDAIFTPDVGLPIVWAARYLAMNGKRRLIGSYWHGSMANAMPQADRRASRLARPAGDLALRRRRLHHADGRSVEPQSAQAPGQGVRVQQRVTRIRRPRAEIDRLPPYRHRSRQSKFRSDGGSDRHQRQPHRGPEGRRRGRSPKRSPIPAQSS